jgi:hypothetical protein
MTKVMWIFATGLIVAACLQAQNESSEKAAQLQNLAVQKFNLEMLAVHAELSSAQFGLVGGIVQGAPYSADATTESVQVLGDGTRLRHHTSFSVARDGQGRIARQENGQTVFVLDPVANASYNFDHVQKTVQQLPLARAPKDNWLDYWLAMGGGFEIFSRNPAKPPVVRSIRYEGLKSVTVADILKRLKERNVGLSVESPYDPAKVQLAVDVLKELLAERGRMNATVEVHLDQSSLPTVRITFLVDEDKGAAAHPATQGQPDDASRKTEGLGQRTIEGLTAEGRRITTTIPIGAIGNDRPIQTTSERWYSPELQVNLRTERHDPRTGDSVFQLTNIRRGEPARSLFEAPPGYSVKALVKKPL